MAVYAQVTRLAGMQLLQRTEAKTAKAKAEATYRCGVPYEGALALARSLDVPLNDLLWEPV